MSCDWQQFAVILLVVVAARSLVRRAWRSFAPARSSTPGSGCDGCPSGRS